MWDVVAAVAALVVVRSVVVRSVVVRSVVAVVRSARAVVVDRSRASLRPRVGVLAARGGIPATELLQEFIEQVAHVVRPESSGWPVPAG
jgi:hypothetical protein